MTVLTFASVTAPMYLEREPFYVLKLIEAAEDHALALGREVASHSLLNAKSRLILSPLF